MPDFTGDKLDNDAPTIIAVVVVVVLIVIVAGELGLRFMLGSQFVLSALPRRTSRPQAARN